MGDEGGGAESQDAARIAARWQCVALPFSDGAPEVEQL